MMSYGASSRGNSTNQSSRKTVSTSTVMDWLRSWRIVAVTVAILLPVQMMYSGNARNDKDTTLSVSDDHSLNGLLTYLKKAGSNETLRSCWDHNVGRKETDLDRLISLCHLSDRMTCPASNVCYGDDRHFLYLEHCSNATECTQQITSETVDSKLSMAAFFGVVLTWAVGSALVWLSVSFTGVSLFRIGIGAASISGGSGLLASNVLLIALQHSDASALFTYRVLIIGAVTGALGSGAGGLVSMSAMRSALEMSLQRRNINWIGTVASIIVGGTCGGLVAGGIETISQHEALFTDRTILATLIGITAGIGGSLAAGGTMLSWGQYKVIPVHLTEADQDLVVPITVPKGPVSASEVFLLCFSEEMGEDFREATSDMLRTQPQGLKHFTIIVHGDGGRLYAPVHYRGEHVYRPTSPELLGDLINRYRSTASPQITSCYSDELKLISCNGGWSNAQRLANAMGQRVWAAYTTVDVDSMGSWHAFDPT